MSACATSPAKAPEPPPAAVATQTKIERRCPALAVAELPQRIPFVDGELIGTAAVLDYVNRRFRREEALEARAVDVKADCPKT